ncbi:MAG: prepilin-type N-terminal cleavage/methylation domain-containing protein [Gemmatimonadaceae bacterium]|nr:prepilin-type N-terminal cleavage/methylation domain-containing protein [Gemmatimonadaceae bacterium]
MRTRPGFTLIEVVIAAFVFAVGVLALEATAVTALRQLRRAADLSLAASVARTRLETLAASRCAGLTGGVDTIGAVISAWSLEPTASPSIRGVSQTVTYELDGAERADSYHAMVQCSP